MTPENEASQSTKETTLARLQRLVAAVKAENAEPHEHESADEGLQRIMRIQTNGQQEIASNNSLGQTVGAGLIGGVGMAYPPLILLAGPANVQGDDLNNQHSANQ